MTTVINVTQYLEEGIAVVQDTAGKYIITKDSDKIQEIPSEIQKSTYRPSPCVLLQSRESMLT